MNNSPILYRNIEFKFKIKRTFLGRILEKLNISQPQFIEIKILGDLIRINRSNEETISGMLMVEKESGLAFQRNLWNEKISDRQEKILNQFNKNERTKQEQSKTEILFQI